MKKGLIAGGLFLLVTLLMGAYLETRQQGWIPLRTSVTADDTALDGTTSGYTYQFADKPAAARSIPPEWNGAFVYFYGTDAADEYVNYKIYVWRENGPAMLWCYGVATLGTALQGTGSYYADTITATDVHGDVTFTDSAANRVCMLDLGDMIGIKWVYAEFDLPASGQVASVGAEITGY